MSNGTQVANPEALVTTDFAVENLATAGIRVVEVDVDTTAYDKGHLAGAVGWDWRKDLQERPSRDVASREKMEALLSRSGVGPDDTILLYGDNNNWFAAFAFWILKIYGHQDVRLMDGGRKKWVADARPLTTDEEKPEASDYTAQEADKSLRANVQDVLKNLENGQFNLVDVRSPAEFTGEVIAPPGMTETAQRGGHVPGAKNIPWAQAVNEDGTFKDADALKSLYGAKGVDNSKPVIAYCRIGERSSHTWFVLHYLLGYPNCKNYDGSWTEYGSMIGVPIEKP